MFTLLKSKPDIEALKSEYKRITTLNARLVAGNRAQNQTAVSSALDCERKLRQLGVPEFVIMRIARDAHIEVGAKLPDHLQTVA